MAKKYNKQKSDKTEQRWPKTNKNRDGKRVKDKKKMAKNDKQTLSDKPEQRWPETNKNKDGQRL